MEKMTVTTRDGRQGVLLDTHDNKQLIKLEDDDFPTWYQNWQWRRDKKESGADILIKQPTLW